MLSHLSRDRLFVNLWTVTCQALLSMGLSQQGCWSGLPCPPPGDPPDPGTEPTSFTSPALAGGLFTARATGSSEYSLGSTYFWNPGNHWGFHCLQSLPFPASLWFLHFSKLSFCLLERMRSFLRLDMKNSRPSSHIPHSPFSEAVGLWPLPPYLWSRHFHGGF